PSADFSYSPSGKVVAAVFFANPYALQAANGTPRHRTCKGNRSMSLKAVPSSLRATRWPTVSWRTLSFLGGFSFLGFWFLPKWLMAPLFFLTPAFVPLLLAPAGL